MTTVRFLNGLDTIGGNIVEFATDTSRVIMDFGVAADLTDETVETAIAHGKLPALPELFFDQPDKYEHEAIFISHLHIDHMGALKYLKKNIPIYMSIPTYQLYQTLINLGIEEPVDNLHAISFDMPVKVGDFSVTGMPSDHDEPGVVAFLVNDGRHNYGYSADVRLNGPKRERVDAWAKQFHDQHLALFLVEGTTFSFDTEAPVEDQANPSTPLSEMALQTQFGDILDHADKLVVINPYQRNYARLSAFFNTTAAHGRQLVVEPAEATIMEALTQVRPDLVIGETIDLDTIREHPEQYVLQNSFAHLDWLADLPVSVYLHSNGEPLGDYDPRFEQLKTWLADHQIPLQFLSASGHASREDLITLVKMVNPRIVVPWHSFHPEREAEALDEQTRAEVLLPEKDLYYTMDETDIDE